MHKELLEQGADMQDSPEKYGYQRYQELGGIINEKDYTSAMTRAKDAITIHETQRIQAEHIAGYAGIELNKTKDTIDQRIVLYGILRSDVSPEGVEHHHQQMSDQQIFVEALRMLGDTESVNKMIKAHPNISFKYQRGS